MRSGCAAAVVLLALGATACGTTGTSAGPESGGAPGPRVVQPGLPGEASEVLPEGTPIGTSYPHTEADVRFMQGMIHHHAQALAMTALAAEQAGSADIRLLARRIEISQHDEIAFMQRWLTERDERAPAVDLEQMHHLAGEEEEYMPGMLTHAQMEQLAAASGSEFDRLFLEFMIQHHDGALIMVDELFANDGAAQEMEIEQFVSHVEADQSTEIRRMQNMLREFR